MRDRMIDHGLEPPQLATDTGYFQVIFPGPGEDLKRLRVPAGQAGQMVPPSVEAQLTKRQRAMVALLVKGEELTSLKCVQRFQITRETVNQDFGRLVELGIAHKHGAGRSTRYALSRTPPGIVR
jgi:predicted HTH transcriptional regulator